MKQKAIICDLDGTLFDIRHREHLAREKKWDEFHAAMINDTPHNWCAQLIRTFCFSDVAGMFDVLYVTGRPEKYRETSAEVLRLHRLDLHEALFMRKDNDFRKDAVVKTEIYNEHIKDKYDILFCLEDRKQAVDAWRALGLTCLQCAEGDF